MVTDYSPKPTFTSCAFPSHSLPHLIAPSHFQSSHTADEEKKMSFTTKKKVSFFFFNDLNCKFYIWL